MSLRIDLRSVMLAAALAAIASLPAVAAEGRIPIPFTSPPVTPIVITASGKYILTRNLAPTGPGNTIEINVPGGSVDLDLNGFNVSGNGGASVISVVANTEVRIHDGALQGGANGINIAVGVTRGIVIERIRTTGATSNGITIPTAANVDIRDCLVIGTGAGIGISIAGAIQQAMVQGNVIQNWATGISASAPVSTVAILNNRVFQTSTTGIFVGGITSIIAENTVRAEGTTGILLTGNGCKVFDNTVSRCSLDGIRVSAAAFANLIWRNVIREVTGGAAINVQGDQNEIAGNVMNNNACGLEFVAGADNNVYRENMARANTGGPPVCAAAPCAPNFGNLGAGNSTAGNNFVPTGVAPCN